MAKDYSKHTWVDEVLAAAAKYLIKDDGGTPVYNNAEITLATSITTPGSDVTAARMQNIEDGIDALDTMVRAAATEVAVASGVLTMTLSRHTVTPETGTADDIDTISGIEEDTIAVLVATNPGTDTLTLKHGTGNISCLGGADIDLSEGLVLLYYDGTTVFALGGGAGGGGGISNVVEDTTPQLGGDLDLNGNAIDFPTTPNIADVLDEDNMASDSAVALATQQSIKAYIDAQVATKIADLVEDTTPQLGGDLDLNSHAIDFPTTPNIADVLDEDNMASDSATKLATQQSIKAYADTKLPLAGGTMTGDLVGGGNALHGFEGEGNAQTGTTYTTQDSDCGKVITLDNASAITVTVHQGAAAGFNCLLIQKGAGQVTVAAGGTGNIRNRQSHTKISGQYGVASIFVESNAGTAPEVYLMGDTAS